MSSFFGVGSEDAAAERGRGTAGRWDRRDPSPRVSFHSLQATLTGFRSPPRSRPRRRVFGSLPRATAKSDAFALRSERAGRRGRIRSAQRRRCVQATAWDGAPLGACPSTQNATGALWCRFPSCAPSGYMSKLHISNEARRARLGVYLQGFRRTRSRGGS